MIGHAQSCRRKNRPVACKPAELANFRDSAPDTRPIADRDMGPPEDSAWSVRWSFVMAKGLHLVGYAHVPDGRGPTPGPAQQRPNNLEDPIGRNRGQDRRAAAAHFDGLGHGGEGGPPEDDPHEYLARPENVA